MKKYESYKDSGVDWIGDIPKDWNISKLKFYANVYTGNSLNDTQKSDFESDDLDHLAYVASKDIDVNTTNVNYENGTRVPREGFNLKVASAHSSLLCIEGGSAGRKMAFLNQDVCFVNKLACIDLENKWLSKYVFYYLKSDLFQKQFFEAMAGLIGGVSITNLRNFQLPIPPNFDAIEIACYLDHQTAIIDELIERKEKLVLALEEKRKAVINEAVTKGLNPNVRMKDSGIDWIGEIPEHWESVPLRYMTSKVGSGVTPRGGADVYVEEGVIFIRSQNVHFEGLFLDDVVKIDEETHQKMENTKVLTNDVLLNITGASIGRCCFVELNGEMNVNQHVCILRCNDKLEPKYLNLLLQSEIGQGQIKLGITGGNREGLNFEAIKNFKFPVPEISEQNLILNELEDLLEIVFQTKNKIDIQIKKLQEYRQSLISEVVTGKVDVRDWEINN